jgi:hypothetical protein
MLAQSMRMWQRQAGAMRDAGFITAAGVRQHCALSGCCRCKQPVPFGALSARGVSAATVPAAHACYLLLQVCGWASTWPSRSCSCPPTRC